MKAKLQKEFMADDDGTVVVPKEALPEVSVTALKKTVKREMTPAQRANMERVIAANKERWAKKREEKANAAKAEVNARKAEDEAKVEAGTHIRVKLKEKTVYTKRTPPPPKAAQPASSHDYPEDESEPEPQPVKPQPVKPRRVVYEDSEPEVIIKRRPKPRVVYQDTSDTEDTEVEEDRHQQRFVRREVKKNLKTLEHVETVLQRVMPANPYLAMLEARWK